jgi:phage nucleotide-binding protein
LADTAVDLETKPSIGGVPITTAADMQETVNILFYGEPGVGKTVLCGSSSVVDGMAPVLFVDVEGGTLSLKDHYPLVDTVRITDWQDMVKVYDSLRKGEGGYQTVVLDSITEVQKFSMNEIMRRLVAKEPDSDPDVPGMREWGKNIEQMRRLVRNFRDLPMNVLFTALEATDKDDRGRRKTYPSLPGKLAGEVPGFVDIVIYMYVKVQEKIVKRMLLTESTGAQVAKDRSNRLPRVIEQPTMEEIYNLITQEGSSE